MASNEKGRPSRRLNKEDAKQIRQIIEDMWYNHTSLRTSMSIQVG